MPSSLRRLSVSAAALLVLLLSACASAPRVSSIAEPGFAPGADATYAWQPVARERAEELDPRVDNDVVRGMLQRGIDRALAAKGYRQATDVGSADLLVSYRVGVRDRREERTEVRQALPMPSTRIVCGMRGCVPLTVWGHYGPPVISTRTIEYTEGGVMIDLVDRASGQLRWRATLTDRPHTDRMPTQEKVDEAMRSALESLPSIGGAP